jgi:hypothetical protein
MGNAPPGVTSVPLEDVPSGSIILVRQVAATPFGQLDPSIVRGIAAAQRGGTVSVQQQTLASWTHCGILLERKGKRYIAQATTTGVQLMPAAKHIRKLIVAGARVAVRRLSAPVNDSMSQVLTSLLHATAAGCEWERYMPELARDSPAQAGAVLLPFQTIRLPRPLPGAAADEAASASPAHSGVPSPGQRVGAAFGGSTRGSDANPAALGLPPFPGGSSFRTAGSDGGDTVRDTGSLASSAPSARLSYSATHRSGGSGGSARSADLSPFARELIRMVIPRIYGALQTLPARTAVELQRAFAVVDSDGDGRCVSITCVKQGERRRDRIRSAILTSPTAHLFSLSLSLSLSLFLSLSRLCRRVPVDAVAAVLSELRGAPLSPADVRAFVACMDAADDAGCVTMAHFTAAFARQPLRDIPLEHDLDAILCGELCACIYELMGLLPPRNAAVYGSAPPTRPLSSAAATDGGAGAAGAPVGRSWTGGAATSPALPSSRRGSQTSAPGDSASARGRPPLSPEVQGWGAVAVHHRSHATASATSGSRSSGFALHGSLVVVDASVADFRHFTPLSFSTLHKPRLQLLLGRLEPEEAIDLPDDSAPAAPTLSAAEDDGKHGDGDGGGWASGRRSARSPSGLASAATLSALMAGTALQDPSARPTTGGRQSRGGSGGGGQVSARASPGPAPGGVTASARAPRLDDAELPSGRLRIGVAASSGADPPALSTPMAISRARGAALHDSQAGTEVAIDVRSSARR